MDGYAQFSGPFTGILKLRLSGDIAVAEFHRNYKCISLEVIIRPVARHFCQMAKVINASSILEAVRLQKV